MISCTKTAEDAPTPVPCKISGTSVNIGSTSGGNFSEQVSTGPECPYTSIREYIYFNNITLNFSIETSNATGCPKSTSGQGILDAGLQTCLDFTYSGSPSATNVAFVAGHGYVGQFRHGHIVKFIAKSYTNGKVNIEYKMQ